MKKAAWAVLVCLLVGLAGSQGLWAQITASASIQGTILDKTQAVVPNASVTATNKQTGLSRSTVTNSVGSFRIDLLPPGVYTVKIAATGFAQATADNVELSVGRTSSVNVTLNPGTANEVMEVTAEAPLVDQTKTDVSRSISPSEVQDLPLINRDFANLAVLAPGAKPVDSYDPTKNRIAVFGINGSSGRNVNVTVNGIDNKDNTVGGPVMQLPLEAVQEFIISTQRFSASNGRSEGAAVNVITKSGTNTWHGSLYFFDRNEALNAIDYFSDTAHGGDGNKAPFDRQQFGGSVGGPVRKDKDFIFFALERQREHTSIPVTPEAFAELSLVQSLGAEPSSAIPTPYFDWRYTGRWDHRFNEKHNAYITYSSQSNFGENDQSTSTNDLSAGNFTKNELQLANFTLNSVLTPRVVNAFTFGYQYWNNLIDTKAKVPTVFFPSSITFGTNSNVPQQSYQKKWQFKDDVSIVHGKHNFKTGVDYVWEPKLGGFFEFTPTPEIDFLDLPSVILSDTTKYPQGFATPGAVVGMSATNGDPKFDLAGGAKMLGLYFQDDWKVTRSLTLNLGLRYDRDFNLIGGGVQEKNRTYQVLKAIDHPVTRALPEDDLLDFSPRVGFAWDVTGQGKHIVRGGYGLYYGQAFLNIPLFMIQQTNPTLFAGVFSISSSGPGDPNADTVPGTNIKLSDWRYGIDPLPTIPPPQTELLANNTGRIMDPDYRNPYSQQWNIGYSYQLNPNTVIEAEYVHELALHESKTININPTSPALGGARILTAALLAAGQVKLGRVDNESSVGRSRYDGFNLSYRQRMTHHFSINTTYVLSRAVAYQGNPGAFRNRPTQPDNPFQRADFGPAPNDETHRWTMSGVVDLPWGIQFAPIMQVASARPYDAIQGIDVFGVGSGRGNAHVILLKSDPKDLLATKSMTASQLRACIAAGDCYQSNFDQLRGAPFFQLDTRVSKAIKFGDRYNLKLIFQAYDLTNRANFGNNYSGNIRSSLFRQPIAFINPSGVTVPHQFSAEFGAHFTF